MIIETSPQDPQTQALLRQSHALMQSLFDPGECHYLDLDALADPTVTIWRNDLATGVIALSRKDSYAEVKSMFLDEATRGSGLADRLLSHLIAVAKSEGVKTLKLETGDVLYAAHKLYARHGFEVCEAFGDYPKDAPRSVYMAKPL